MENSPELEENNLEEWTKYVDQLEHFFRVNEIAKDDQKLYSFLALIGPFLYMKLKSLISPSNPEDMTYETLVDKLILHSILPPSKAMQRYLFNTREWSPDESLEAYLLQLKLLGSFCNFHESLDTMLRDRLICGIGDQKIQLKLLQTDEITLEKAVEIAGEMEPLAQRSVKTFNKGDSCIRKPDESTITAVTALKADSEECTEDSGRNFSIPCPIPPYLPPKIGHPAYQKMVLNIEESKPIPSHRKPAELASRKENLSLVTSNEKSSSTNDRKGPSSKIRTAANIAYVEMDSLTEPTSSPNVANAMSSATDNTSMSPRHHSSDKDEDFKASDIPEDIQVSDSNKGSPQIEAGALSEPSPDHVAASSSVPSLQDSPLQSLTSCTEDGSSNLLSESETLVVHRLSKLNEKETSSHESLHKVIISKDSNSLSSRQPTPEHNMTNWANSVRMNTNNLIKKKGSKITNFLHKLNKDDKKKTHDSEECPSAVSFAETEINTELLTERYMFPGHLGYGIRILKKPAGKRDKPAHWKIPTIRGMVEATSRFSQQVKTNQLYYDVAIQD